LSLRKNVEVEEEKRERVAHGTAGCAP